MPELVSRGKMTVVGIDVRTRNADEGAAARARLPGLWARFYGEGVLDRVPGKHAPALPIGVYTDYEGDHAGEYRVVAGAAVADGTPVPEGMASATVPEGRYLLFKGEGRMPDAVVKTWMLIWDHFSKPGALVRAYTADFEVYREAGAVDIYISVK